jgi:tetratricopeptide (TPR) repeat protein
MPSAGPDPVPDVNDCQEPQSSREVDGNGVQTAPLQAAAMNFTELLLEADSQLQAGYLAGAQAIAEQILTQDPDNVTCWCLVGRIARQAGRLGDAVAAYEQAAELDPQLLSCRTELGYLLRDMALPEASIYWHGEALALQPNELILNLNHLFVLPIVAHSAQQMEQLRQRCLGGLDRLEKRAQSLDFGDYSMSHHPFYLIYYNCDDRAVLESYGRLLGQHLTKVDSPPRPGRPPGARPRIAFLSGFFFSHSNSRAFEGLIRYLDRRQFEVVVIHLSTSKSDEVRDRIDACADQVVVLVDDFEGAQRQLLRLELDLLFFTDIGMHPVAMMLACCRSAPVQVTGWGVPQTSGLSTIDYYISGELVEGPGADAQYTENLVRLPGLPCCYLAENLEPVQHGRDYFFLPQDVPLFGCLQSFSKLHPDFDGVLEQIAQEVPEAWFVFVEADYTSYTQIFMERIAISAPTLAQRLILLSRMERHEFISLAACLDVLLDPPYFGSGITLYETIHTGTPIVTLEGDFLRSRFVAGAYRLMGLDPAPVAKSFATYRDLAVALVRDPEGLAVLRRTIAERARQCLYDRKDVVQGFSEFALQAMALAQAELG